MTLSELADRVEKGGKEPDRDLEVEIWRLLDAKPDQRAPNILPLPWLFCYTESVDDALELLEKHLPGWFVQNFSEWQHATLRDQGRWMAQLKRDDANDAEFSAARANHAQTAARAMTAAVLRGIDWQAEQRKKSLQ